MKVLRSRFAIFCLLAGFNSNAAEPPVTGEKGVVLQPTQAAPPYLHGTWQGVMVGDKLGGRITITIKGNTLHFHRDTNFWFETSIAVPGNTSPQQLQATIKKCAQGQENSIGKVVVAAFKVEGETLTLVARGDGSDEPPQSLESVGDEGVSRYELKRVIPKGKVP